MSYYQTQSSLFSVSYLRKLRDRILASPYFAVNNLNRDFIGTKGFSIVFTREHYDKVAQEFPVFQRYMERALLEDCNAFYLNPLLLQTGSRVDPHIDRSLRSYCKTIDPPAMVSVLYVEVPADLVGGELVLRDRKKQVGEIKPQENLLLHFQGDLTHSVKAVQTNHRGRRLSLVCEQYRLEPNQLSDIPDFTVESRAAYAKK